MVQPSTRELYLRGRRGQTASVRTRDDGVERLDEEQVNSPEKEAVVLAERISKTKQRVEEIK